MANDELQEVIEMINGLPVGELIYVGDYARNEGESLWFDTDDLKRTIKSLQTRFESAETRLTEAREDLEQIKWLLDGTEKHPSPHNIIVAAYKVAARNLAKIEHKVNDKAT